MTIKEFSAEFDILYNNIMSNMAPGLTEYEKSVFLTQAQEQLVIEIYSGQYKGQPFESSEEVREYLKNLIQTVHIASLTPVSSNYSDPYQHYQVIMDNPELWFIISESAHFADAENCPCVRGRNVLVKPVSHDSFWSISRNPFKGPNSNRVLRLDSNRPTIELISKYEITDYMCIYLERPLPIILENLLDDSINGEPGPSDCILPPSIHRPILERAVQLAKNSWGQLQEQQ